VSFSSNFFLSFLLSSFFAFVLPSFFLYVPFISFFSEEICWPCLCRWPKDKILCHVFFPLRSLSRMLDTSAVPRIKGATLIKWGKIKTSVRKRRPFPSALLLHKLFQKKKERQTEFYCYLETRVQEGECVRDLKHSFTLKAIYPRPHPDYSLTGFPLQLGKRTLTPYHWLYTALSPRRRKPYNWKFLVFLPLTIHPPSLCYFLF